MKGKRINIYLEGYVDLEAFDKLVACKGLSRSKALSLVIQRCVENNDLDIDELMEHLSDYEDIELDINKVLDALENPKQDNARKRFEQLVGKIIKDNTSFDDIMNNKVAPKAEQE